MNKIPITPGIPYHSIIGDRGKGDTPNSSDGVVPTGVQSCRRRGERAHRAFKSQLAA